MKDYITAFLGLFAGILFIVMTLTAFAHLRQPEPPPPSAVRLQQTIQPPASEREGGLREIPENRGELSGAQQGSRLH